jgi:hypothetical protein
MLRIHSCLLFVDSILNCPRVTLILQIYRSLAKATRIKIIRHSIVLRGVLELSIANTHIRM